MNTHDALRGNEMLALWTEILPVFIVRWLTRKFCGTVSIGSQEAHEARPGVFILAKGRRDKGDEE